MKTLLAIIVLSIICGFTVKANAFPQSNLMVKGDKIYQNEKLFAEIRYFMTDEKNKKHRGISIYYYQINKEVWIYPVEGWSIRKGEKKYYSTSQVEQIWKELDSKTDLRERQFYQLFLGAKRPDKSDFLSTWCFDVGISPDGKYVYYKTPGLLFSSSHKYAIDYNVP